MSGRPKTPAQVVSLYIGVWWTSNGIGALVSDANFGVSDVHGSAHLLGVNIAVNGWHGLFHLGTGLIGIAVAMRPQAARSYLLAAGGLYLLVAGWGFLAGHSALGVMSVDTVGSAVHAGEGLIALSAALLSPSTADGAAWVGLQRGGGSRT